MPLKGENKHNLTVKLCKWRECKVSLLQNEENLNSKQYNDKFEQFLHRTERPDLWYNVLICSLWILNVSS